MLFNKFKWMKRYLKAGLFILISLSLFANGQCVGSESSEKEDQSIELTKLGVLDTLKRDSDNLQRDTLLLSQLAAILLDIQENNSASGKAGGSFKLCETEGFFELPNFAKMGDKISVVDPVYINKSPNGGSDYINDTHKYAIDSYDSKEGREKCKIAIKFCSTMKIISDAEEIIRKADSTLTPETHKTIWSPWLRKPENFYSWMMSPKVFDEEQQKLYLHRDRFKYIKKLIDPSCEIKGHDGYSPDPNKPYEAETAQARLAREEAEAAQRKKNLDSEKDPDRWKKTLAEDIAKIIVDESQKGDDADDKKVQDQMDLIMNRGNELLGQVYESLNKIKDAKIKLNAVKTLYLAILEYVYSADITQASIEFGDIDGKTSPDALKLGKLVMEMKPDFIIGKMAPQLAFTMTLIRTKWDELHVTWNKALVKLEETKKGAPKGQKERIESEINVLNKEKAQIENQFRNLVVLYVPLLKKLAKQDTQEDIAKINDDIKAAVGSLGEDFFPKEGLLFKTDITLQVLKEENTKRYD